MPVSVETLSGLERKLTISIPTAKIEEATSERLKSLARKVKLDGFRPGKAPMHVIKQRYLEDVHAEVAKDMIQETLFPAIQEKDLKLAGYPAVEPEEIKAGVDFTYHATFEVLPEFDMQELQQDEIEITKAEVRDQDVDQMIEKLREQSKEWSVVERQAEQGDKLNIDFAGFIDEVAFEGGSAQAYELELGSGSMIPGFEDQLIGAKAGEVVDVKLAFPKDYNSSDLAGKDAVFKVTVNTVSAPQLPALDDAFLEKFNITEGGIDALKKDIRQNMERELERKLSSMNRDRIFEALLKANTFEVPNALVEREIEQLKHEMFHRIFGPEHHDNEKIPDLPRELFEEQAKRRVHLGLLFAEYVDIHKIEPDEARIEAMLDKLASAYVDPEEFRNHYKASEERLGEIKALVTEEMVAEKISESAKMVEVTKSYDEVMNSKQAQEDEE
ncbi:MAG: trigger factor [Legionellaceae bacterium]|nr:trigger factor [Legionellaceae bacterium]